MNILFIDMDGVAADFDKKIVDIFGKPFERKASEEKVNFWHYTFTPKFFEELEPAPDLNECIDELWDIYKGNVRFLTALPLHRKDLAYQCTESKMKWVRQHVRKPVPVTFGPFAIDKQHHCLGSHCHLLDDNKKNITQWIDRGGIAFYQDSIDNLKERVEDIKYHLNTDKAQAK